MRWNSFFPASLRKEQLSDWLSLLRCSQWHLWVHWPLLNTDIHDDHNKYNLTHNILTDGTIKWGQEAGSLWGAEHKNNNDHINRSWKCGLLCQDENHYCCQDSWAKGHAGLKACFYLSNNKIKKMWELFQTALSLLSDIWSPWYFSE